MKGSLKKLLTSIINQVPTHETEQIAQGITAFRYGNVVTINMDATASTTPSGTGYKTLGYTKFKPSYRVVYNQPTDNAGVNSNDRKQLFAVVNTDGSIAVWFNSIETLNLRGSVTYVLGGVARNILKALKSLLYRKAVIA